MPISAAARRRLESARRNLERSRARFARNEARLTQLQSTLRELRAASASPARLASVMRRITALRKNRERLQTAVRAASNALNDLRHSLVNTNPAESIANLPAKTPIAMLPVRLEYRYIAVGGRNELKIRVYPQELQIDDHQHTLSSDEIEAGQGFWQSVFEARSSGGDGQPLWRGLARQHGAGRARWIADQLRPLNMDAATSGEAPDFPEITAVDDAALDATVCCLPERWAVLGYRAGKQVVRVWGRTIDESLTVNLADGAEDDEEDKNVAPPDDDTQLPSAPGLDWLMDYDTALAAGMAITLTERDDPQLGQGYDEVLVVGVDWSRSEEESAATFEAMLHNHRYEQGLEIPSPGEPTNLGEEESDAAERVSAFEQRQAAYLNPLGSAEEGKNARDGALLNDGLGLSSESPLLHVPGSQHTIHRAQTDMHTALYEGTLGYFADQMLDPMVSDADVERLKTHFIRYIRPLGALPLLRVGDQPYGVLPVCDTARFTAATNNIGSKIQHEANNWRGYWQSAARRAVPRIGATDDVDDDLLNTLRMSARATDFRIREVIGPTLVANFAHIQTEHAFQETASNVLLKLGGYQKKPLVAAAALSRHHHRVRLPFVQRGDRSRPLVDDYLTRIAEQVRKAGGFKEMLEKKLADPDSVLEAITTYSALLELGKSAARLSVASDASRFKLSRLVARERELHDISDALAPADGIALVNNALATQPAVAADRTVVDEVARLLRDGSAATNINLTVLRPTRRFEAALRRLSAQTTSELEMLLTGALDSVSHRLDCWLSSLANQRLDELRSRNARGLYLGGFGWLDEVRPAPRANGFGMALAPSLNHAQTAAVLKSAHAAHAGDDKKLLAVDLSSARVRKALSLIEGLRQGQTAGALLGYRLERDLQQRRLSLVQYVAPLRRIAPLGQVNQTAPGTPLESIETREVVDGLRILELWRESADFFADHQELPQSGRDKADLERALQALDDTLDALNDLMLAEGVYQYVNGNNERATAALDSLERQTQFPEPDIAATPRSASVYHHRLVVTLDDSGLASQWNGLPALQDDPRARVDARLNRWLGNLLGDPQKYQFSGTLFVNLEKKDAGVKKVIRQQQEVVTARLMELKLHPVSIVAAANTPSADKPSELEARVEQLLRSKVQSVLPDDVVGTQMVIHTHAPDPDSVGFGGFSLLVQQMADLLGSAEAGDATSLGPEDAEDPGLDATEFAQRVETARMDFQAAANALNPNDDAQTLRGVLRVLADHGVQNALPRVEDKRLPAQAEQVAIQVQVTQRRLQEHTQGFVRSQASALEQVDHDTRTLKILYGENFVALPLCRVADRQQQQASLDNAAHLLPGGTAQVSDWLQMNATARPSVARLTDLLNASELANVDEIPPNHTTHVIQLPHDPGERWVGLRLQADLVRPQANLAIVVHHCGDTLKLAARQAVLLIDAWEDRIPDVSQDAAVTFQYDAPNARAPQTVLLAVPPKRGQQNWQFDDVVGAVREAKDLAEIRMADLAHLELLPRILPALYFPFDLDEESIALNFGHAIEVGSLMKTINR